MLKFTKDCELGIEELDNDHRKLFELVQKTMDLLHDDFITDKYDHIKELLDELLDYANAHFIREEEYMKKIRDPEIIMQRIQHDHFLMGWLINHILIMDRNIPLS